MRWLCDECVDAAVVACLRQNNHDVVYAAESAPSTRDIEIIELAVQENRLILTEDKDFGELVFRRRRSVPGLVLVRIESGRRQLKWPRLETAIAAIGNNLMGNYTVIEETRLRSRPLVTVGG
jgi:predicted nuclease of predicted toxin-antitoxin system